MYLPVNFLFLAMFGFILGCSTSPKISDRSKISFADFNKVLRPKSPLYPLHGQNKALILIALEKDAYPKVYEYDLGTKSFKLFYDATQPIAGFWRDPKRIEQNRFYLFMDDGGNENYQIYQLNPQTASVKKIFGRKGARAYITDTSTRGDFVYVLSNHENKSRFNLYEVHPSDGKVKRLSTGNSSFVKAVAGIHDRYLALQENHGNNETAIYFLDRITGRQFKALHKDNTTYSPIFFDPQTNDLHILTDYNNDRMGCARIELSSPYRTHWVRQAPNKDVYCSYLPGADLSIVQKSFRGRNETELYRGIFKKQIPVKFPEKAVIERFTAVPQSSATIFASMTLPHQPVEFYRINLEASQKDPLQKATDLITLNLPDSEFARSYDFDFKSFDDKKIHGIVYRKKDWDKTAKNYPLVVWPHGGPDHFVSHKYRPFFQYLVLNGYVVFAPNFRGSTGYGKQFERLNDRDWGGAHIKDVIWGKRAMARLPYVDENQIYIVGASFGGYSTLSAITQYPEEFDGAVAIVALANLFTFMKSIPKDPAWQKEMLTEVGDPEEDALLLRERSPYFHASNIETPLKIYQAENDIRTVKADMDQLVERLKELRVPVEYEVLRGEGHSISKTESLEKVMNGTLQFLDSLKDKK